MQNSAEGTKAEKVVRFFKWYMNPCDIDHYAFLTPAQRFFEVFSRGTDCHCCLGARIFFAFLAGVAVGAAVL